MKNPDLWRELHRPSVDNPVCECAGEHVCCPCTLRDALEELARLRASHARLLEALRAIVHPDAEAIVWFVPSDAEASRLQEQARAAIAAAEGDPEKRVLKALEEIDAAIAAAEGDRHPPRCISCGKNYADPPSKLCPGCEAYADHQR